MLLSTTTTTTTTTKTTLRHVGLKINAQKILLAV
jgi:hypothetical protein